MESHVIESFPVRTSLSPDDYLTERVDDQIAWYDRKSQQAQATFKRLRWMEISCAAAIPLLSGLTTRHWTIPILVGSLGAIVVVVAAFQSLGQYQENWLAYRTTCEVLQREKYFFLTGSGAYNTDTAFTLFVEQVEGVMSKENSGWLQSLRSTGKAAQEGKG